MKSIFLVLLALGLYTSASAQTQVFDSNIKTVKLYRGGDQTSLPIITLNSADVLQLTFDELGNRVKNYSYTFQLCNADWSPSMLRSFEYIKGFQNNRITTYRNASGVAIPYVHYQATIPDRNSAPSLSGNYLLKVFLNNDTSQVAFTTRFMVVNNQAKLATQVQQPFNARLFNSGQRLFITVQTDNRVRVLNPSDLKLAVLQNNNWQTALMLDRPTIYRGNYYEYSDEAITGMPAAKEFRYIDMRSLRLMSDRMQKLVNRQDSVIVYVKPDASRAGEGQIFYRDLNGSYTIESLENVNPFWQADYAWVKFTYMPAGRQPFQGRDVYLFGELTNYAADTSAKMNFNEEKGVYEKTLLLKQGFYNYLYATRDAGTLGPLDFGSTEGNYWATENAYTVLVYYRPFGARADELIGISQFNSAFQRL